MFLKCYFLILLFSFLLQQKGVCQRQAAIPARNQLFLEAGGMGGYGSINYERIYFTKKDWMFGMRAGFGSYRLRDYTNEINPDLLFPITMNAIYGHLHKIECGIGGTIANLVMAEGYAFKLVRKTHFHSALSFAYRYQKNTAGLVFRGSYSPVLEFNRYFRHRAGLSVGYTF